MALLVRFLVLSVLVLDVIGRAVESDSLYREKKMLDFLEQILLREKVMEKKSGGHLSSHISDYVPTDVTDPVERSTIGECMNIMRAYDDQGTGSTSTKAANKAVKSCWPYTKLADCDAMRTRDVEYDPNKKLSSKSLHAEHVCGKNMFMHEDNDQELRSLLKRVFEEPDTETNMESRIVGGEESHAGKYPWMVTIGKSSHGLSCGGAIINKDWILSAAHCFDDRDYPCTYNVRAGSFNWGYDTEGHHEDIPAAKIFRHPDYSEETNDNDIALLKLSKSLDLNGNGYINAVCLPEEDMEDKTYEVGKSCVAAGWGTLKEDGNVPMTLQEVELPLVARKTCRHEGMTINQFCAGSMQGKIDTCQGDSGGPVMCKRLDGRWYQQGVTSYGNGCGRKRWPGVYTQVPHYIHWINSVVDRF